MDLKDGLFIVFVVAYYTSISIVYSSIGNVIANHKINHPKDLFYPFSNDFYIPSTTKSNAKLAIFIYYLVFLILLVFSLPRIISFQNTFRGWTDKLMGDTETAVVAGPMSSRTVLSSKPQQATARAPARPQQVAGLSGPVSSASSTQLSKKTKTTAKSKTPPKRPKEFSAQKMPSVMRLSVVDLDKQIIPPLPKLSAKDETPEKLDRVMKKFASMDISPSDSDKSIKNKKKKTPAPA